MYAHLHSHPAAARAVRHTASLCSATGGPSLRRQKYPTRAPGSSSIARHRNLSASMAMSSSTHQKVKLTEGSNLNDRPDSAKELFLYTHMLCPYAQTALLTLMCKGVPHQVVNIDLSNKPQWFTKLCRSQGFSATVPVVDYQGRAQTESIDICRWVCNTFPGSALSQDKEHIDPLIKRRGGLVRAGLDLLAGHTARQWAIGTNQSRDQWDGFLKQLRQFQAAIDESGGPYLLGPEVSLADLLYMPFMERFALALPDLTASDLRPACEGIMKPWLEAMGQLACCQQAFPDSKLFQQALREERSLDFFDFKTYSAYQLHPHLQ